MIRRIILHNFMSHRHTEIEPANGLTVLVGENNCGKSAVVAALQILCQNANGDYMVRHGENECRVIVETDEGHKIEWKRKNGTVSYTLNGKAIHRLRGGIPDDLHKLLRIPQVYPQDGGEPFDIHFGEQKKPVFLLNESGGRAARFFASSSDAEVLIKMQILHKSNVRDATRRSSQLTSELVLLARRLKPLERVTDIQNQLDDLEIQYELVVTTEENLESLYQYIENIRESIDQVDLLSTEASILSKLKTPPRLRDIKSLREIVISLEEWKKHSTYFQYREQTLQELQYPPTLANEGALETLIYDMSQADVNAQLLSNKILALSNLNIAPKLAPTEDLEVIVKQMKHSLNSMQHQRAKADCFAELDSPPKIIDIDPLRELIEQIRDQFEFQVAVHVSIFSVLETLKSPPCFVDLNELQTLISQMDDTQNTVGLCRNKLDQDTAAAGIAEKALRDWVTEHRICPTCGAELDADRLVTLAVTSSMGSSND